MIRLGHLHLILINLTPAPNLLSLVDVISKRFVSALFHGLLSFASGLMHLAALNRSHLVVAMFKHRLRRLHPEHVQVMLVVDVLQRVVPSQIGRSVSHSAAEKILKPVRNDTVK